MRKLQFSTNMISIAWFRVKKCERVSCIKRWRNKLFTHALIEMAQLIQVFNIVCQDVMIWKPGKLQRHKI